MGEFYADAHYAFDGVRAKAAFEQLVTDDRLGALGDGDHPATPHRASDGTGRRR